MPYDQPQPPVQPPSGGEAAESAAALLDDLDRRLRGRLATFMGGQSAWAAMEAWGDWAFHLAASPGRQIELAMHAARAAAKLRTSALHGGAKPWAFEPLPADRRFRAEAWNRFPFNLMAQAQLALEAQWRLAARDLRGVSQHHQRRIEFLGELVLNAIAPINGVLTNPEVLDAAVDTGGGNFLKGSKLFVEDFTRLALGGRLTGLESFKTGSTMAITPGEVVFRNDLMEVIQYAPTTPKVQAEPVLIVPAWIMKYYILDLTPESSLVRHLVDQGFTVFMISWRNPGAEAQDVSLEDYRIDGVEKAIDVVSRIVDGEKIHAVGYCLGGTTLAITAAALGRDGRDGLATLSLLAAQTDFDDAGELLLFIDESQLSLLEDMMLAQGYLEARQMSGAFYALRANDMLWSQLVERYLIAKPKPLGPLDAWLADATRMPARMHGEYLRGLFLDNSFAHGRYETPGGALAMKDITVPVFALGAERDHIAPWRSVYKIELYGSTDTTFVLTGGGHNTSVVSPPGKAGAYYWVRETEQGQPYAEPDVWWTSATREAGSWWPCWAAWLKARARGDLVDPPAMGGGLLEPLGPAPGAYVFET